MIRFYYYYDFGHLEPGRYYCGDSFQLLPAVESESADMVLIDPPYYMEKDKEWDTFDGKADYLAFMGRAFIQAQRILKPNGTMGFWHNDLQKIAWLCDWLEKNTDLRFATWGLWVKPTHRKKLWACPGPGNIKGENKDNQKQPDTETLPLTSVPLPDGKVKASTTAETPQAVYDNWTKAVWVKDTTTA